MVDDIQTVPDEVVQKAILEKIQVLVEENNLAMPEVSNDVVIVAVLIWFSIVLATHYAAFSIDELKKSAILLAGSLDLFAAVAIGGAIHQFPEYTDLFLILGVHLGAIVAAAIFAAMTSEPKSPTDFPDFGG